MPLVRIELEHVCSFCGNVVTLNKNAYIDNITNDIRIYLGGEHCTECELSTVFLSNGMDISKVSIPVRSNFGASIL